MKKDPTFELDETIARQAQERAEVEKELTGMVPLDQRDWFKTLMRIVQQFDIWQVEHAYYCEMYQHSITRYVLIETGKRLSQVGCIAKAEETLFLVPEELYKALSDPEVCSLKSTVMRRRAKWEENAQITPPPLFAKVSPEEAANMLLKSKDPMAVKVATGMMGPIHTEREADLRGQIASPGIAEGPARVIFSAEQLGEVQEGDILVAPAIWASWSPVFAMAKGAVIDSGSILSSAAIVGREYGIPVVTNVIEGTTKIRTGQRLKVDGNVGTVHIVSLLEGKRILIVDDEPDVLETLEEFLPMCDVVKAGSFQEAANLLKGESFDMAILDIMGVDGYGLLAIAKERKVIAVMLTAHALSLDDTVRSYREGASSYIPKEKLSDIATFLNDVLESKEKGESFWGRWFDRFAPYYDSRFGSGWQNKHKEFWEIFRDKGILDI